MIGCETDVLKKYKKIVEENDRKIRNNKNEIKELRQRSEEDEKIDNALKKVAKLIEQHPAEYSYVKLYSNLVKSKNMKMKSMNGSRFAKYVQLFILMKKDGTCGHFMHKVFYELRKMTEKLEERIVRMSK